MVVARNTRTSENGLVTGKGNVDFHGKTAKIIEDPGLATEIDTQYGLKGTGDVWVARDEMYENKANYHDSSLQSTHNYFFGPSKSFADAWDELQERRKEKEMTKKKKKGKCK